MSVIKMDRLKLKCPVCGKQYMDHPALSRRDNKTLICPECGIRESLEDIGIVAEDEQEHVLDLVKEYEKKHRGER